MKKSNLTSHQNNFASDTCAKTFAIIQLTRIGDVLQTIQSAKFLKKQTPEIRLILIARPQFAKGLEFMIRDTFDKCYYINTSVINHNAQKLTDSLQNLNDLLADINNENIQVLINLSFSNSSAYLASLIKARHKMGLYYHQNNSLKIQDTWSQFIYSNVMGGSLNPFSLVDIFKTMLGANNPSIEIPITKLSEPLPQIVIHPFASLAKKHWKANKWAEVLYHVLKAIPEVTIKIVGTSSDDLAISTILESPLLQRYAKRICNLCGKTNYSQLYDLIAESKLFVGHDSMVGHIAALAGTQSLTISLGTVRAIETTPYRANNYNITPKTPCFPCYPDDSCSYHQCHSDIPYQVVCSSITQLYNEQKLTDEFLEKNNTGFLLNSVDIMESFFTKSGYLELRNVINKHPDFPSIMRMYYRICWQFVFNSTEEFHQFPELTKNNHQQLLNYLNGLQYLFELNNFGQKYCKYILEEISSPVPQIDKIKEFSLKIDEIDDLQKLITKTYPALSPFINFTTVQKGNLKGDNVVQLTESAYLVYYQSANLTGTLYELIEKTIAEHKLKNNISHINHSQNTFNR